MKTEDFLDERAKTHGLFFTHAQVSMALKQTVRHHIYEQDKKLEPDQWEALEMICHKIGRIVNGDHNHVDHWDDIQGYARLVANRLRKDTNTAPF